MKKLKELNDFKSAYAYALRLIALKDYTSKMLEDKLRLRNLPEDTAKEVIKELENKGYIDNRDYGRRFIEDSTKLKNKGRKYIEFELIKRGFSREEAEMLIDECYSSPIEEAFEKILKKYNKKYEELDIKEKNSVKNKLLRQGYVYEEISELTGKKDTFE